ncbi:unnamed protein product, partial [Musa textilis]
PLARFHIFPGLRSPAQRPRRSRRRTGSVNGGAPLETLARSESPRPFSLREHHPSIRRQWSPPPSLPQGHRPAGTLPPISLFTIQYVGFTIVLMRSDLSTF